MSNLEILTGQPGLFLQPKQALFCHDFGKTRIYFSPDALTDPSQTFSGVTDVIKNSAGDTGFLVQWRDKQAQVAVVTGELPDETEYRTSEAMEYGSFFHGLIPGLVAQGLQYDPLHLTTEVNGYLIKKNLMRYDSDAWERKAMKHLMAFLQWIQDERLEIIGVELPVTLIEFQGAEFRMASRIDLVCRNKNGEVMLVDIKTGERSYKGYRGYQYQLGYYELMLKANYPELAISGAIPKYNWSPKDWQKSPTYHFDKQPDTPFSILAGMAEKFWYEHEDDFLTRSQLEFQNTVLRPDNLTPQRKTYYELIQQDILSLRQQEAAA